MAPSRPVTVLLSFDALLAFAALLAVRHAVLLWTPELVFNGYFFLFPVVFGLSLWLCGDALVALAVGLWAVFARAAYRYRASPEQLRDYAGPRNTTAFALCLAAASAAAVALAPRRDAFAFRLALYLSIMYAVGSLGEWGAHYFIMHCWQRAAWMLEATGPLGYLRQTCLGHKAHHEQVQPDMRLAGDVRVNGLSFDWSTTAFLAAAMFGATYCAAAALRLRIPLFPQLLAAAAAALAHMFVWNNVHPNMHRHATVIPISWGLPNVGAALAEDSLMYRNHEAHHLVKGAAKGNYNVIFLGTDEVFGTNRLAEST